MFNLWSPVENSTQFDPLKHHAAEVFGKDYEKFLPYHRNYGALFYKAQIQELICDAKENHWQALDLSCCGLSELPQELWELTDLRILYIGNNVGTQEIHGRKENTISFISRKIERLKNLQVFSMTGLSCRITGDSPLDLPNLCYLDIYDCGFSQIPKTLLIPSIKEIGFTCRGKQLSPSFVSLVNLKKAYLANSEFITLPDQINQLEKLETLSVFGSKLASLPDAIASLPNLKHLIIDSTPLAKSLPPEILRQSAQEIIRYVLGQQSNVPKEYFNESKMIIVGQGHVGKSSLLKRLVENRYDEEQSTEGINISKWNFRWGKNDIRLNIWDFGGQEIYHSTHQFFLTKRSLYLLVWDVLAEKEYGRIDYWLRTIQSLADDSPIIIAVNKCDNGIGRIERIDIDEYRSKYPQIQDIMYVSCKDNANIAKLRDLIKKTAAELPLMHMKWLKPWMDVRREIEREANRKESISYSTYLTICENNGIQDEEEALSLIKYLHDLGIVLYYHDDPLLKNLVILSSEWGTDAVYKVLDEQERSLKGKNGVLLTSGLSAIWKDKKKYPPEYYQHLLNLMAKFQLAFRIDQDSYLVAELLNNQSIDLKTTYKKSDALSLRYEYDFLPAGVMTRFIVSANQFLVTENGVKQCWRKGAYLSYRSANALVRLFDDIADRYIQIDVIGEDPREKKDLLTIIRYKLDEINSRFNKIKITEKVPCKCSENCPFLFDYKTLLTAEKKGKQTVECHVSLDDVPLSKLLDGIENTQTGDESNVIYYFVSTKSSGFGIDGELPINVKQMLLENRCNPSHGRNSFKSPSAIDGINEQLIAWASVSNLFNMVMGEPENEFTEQDLKSALCGDESVRVRESYHLMERIWKNHPEWGLMPDYMLLSSFEHSGKYYQQYRDHLAHMFKVLLLGLYLYETSADISTAFQHKNVDSTSFAAIWSITTLYHDIGYVFDTLDKSIDGDTTQSACKALAKIFCFPLHHLFPDLIDADYEEALQNKHHCYTRHTLTFAELINALRAFAGRGSSVGLSMEQTKTDNPILEYYTMLSYPNSMRSYFDHGISSAMILLFQRTLVHDYVSRVYNALCAASNPMKPGPVLNKLKEGVTKLNQALPTMSKFTEEAAFALAVHNINQNHSDAFIRNLLAKNVTIRQFKIPLSEEPFAYLLRICDELQCWDRPQMSDPIRAEAYLQGTQVHLKNNDGHPVLSIDEAKEREKIVKALNNIIDPSIEMWLESFH